MQEKQDSIALWRETISHVEIIICQTTIFIYILNLLASRDVMKILATLLIFVHRKLLEGALVLVYVPTYSVFHPGV